MEKAIENRKPLVETLAAFVIHGRVFSVRRECAGEKIMNILVVGNGFDLEHGLPTKYVDFLEFVKNFKIMHNQTMGILDELDGVKDEYLRRIFWEKALENRVKALHRLLDGNVWISHFEEAYKENLADKENWVDFEKEISEVIRSMDGLAKYYEGRATGESENKNLKSYYQRRVKNIGNFFSAGSIKKKIPDLLRDLDRLIEVLEIYIWDNIGNKEMKYYNPDIERMYINKILSFNYSDTYRRLYAFDREDIDYSYIHGKAVDHISSLKVGKSMEEEWNSWMRETADLNNMVLGIDEYLTGDSKNKETDFIAFKKYYQRIYKKNGNEYKKWLDQIDTNIALGKEEENKLYIFGHSLNETDGDVLRELITHPQIETIIYYRDKKQLGQQIANLVKVLGSDQMVEMVYGNHPAITFQEQSKRKLIEGSSFEIASDARRLRGIYKLGDDKVQELLEKIDQKIKQKELDYFHSQEEIITLFDALQKNGLKEYEKELWDIACDLRQKEGLQKAEHHNPEEWTYLDNNGIRVCNSLTLGFIEKINSYNKKAFLDNQNGEKSMDRQLEVYRKMIDCRKELEEEEYEFAVDHIFDMFHEYSDIESLWDVLIEISSGIKKNVAESILRKKMEMSRNALDIIRCKHLLSEIGVDEEIFWEF